jgi:hypothetical protein
MPIYVMKCPGCGAGQEIYRPIARMNDDLPECCGQTMRRQVCAPAVVTDIPAYQAVAVDKSTGKMPMIEGRKQHREYLKRNGYIEVGNEKLSEKPRELVGDFNVKPQLIEATKQVLAQQRK